LISTCKRFAKTPTLENPGEHQQFRETCLVTHSLVSSSVGVLAKRLQVEINYTSTKTDGQARPQLLNDEIWQLGFAWEPRRI